MTAPLSVAERTTLKTEKEMAERLEGVPQVDLVAHLRAALGKMSMPALVSEIWRLNRGPGRLGPHEYFYYRLYDSPLSLQEKQAFVGKKAQDRMHRTCNDALWFAVLHDKLLFAAAMEGLGLPTPKRLAVYHRFRHAGDVPIVRSAVELASFLRERITYPFFAKPIEGIFSLGSRSVDALDRQTDELVLAEGERVPVEHFAAYVEAAGDAGYLFQERMEPHGDLAQAFGPAVSTIRFLVLLGDDGPELFRAVCKIPAGRNVADNYWRPGNMAGAVELETGRITRIVSGVGEGQTLHDRHPDTFRPLVGMTVPLWAETKALSLAAAATLPGVRTQAWDIAVTREGPVLVEANFGGDLNLAQLAFGAGILDDRFRDHLKSCGYRL